MRVINLDYYYTNELNQLELLEALAAEHSALSITQHLIESENQVSPKSEVQILPCFIFKAGDEVIKLYGNQSQVEIETLIKELT